MFKLTATKKDGRLKFHREDDYFRWIKSQEDGQIFRIEVKTLRATKTMRQLAYYYGVVVPAIMQWMTDQGWDSIGAVEICGTRVPLAVDIENTDHYLKILYATSRGIKVEIKKARMSKVQMMDFLDFILAWAFENAMVIPSPEMEE